MPKVTSRVRTYVRTNRRTGRISVVGCHIRRNRKHW